MATAKCRVNSNFHKSVLGQIFKYLILMLNLSGIYVPAVCICPREPHTSPVRSVCDKNKNNVVSLRDVDQHSKVTIFCNAKFSTRNNRKISPAHQVKKTESPRCQCGDNYFVKMCKTIFSVFKFLFHLSDNIRYVFILRNTLDRDLHFVLSLVETLMYLHMTYLFIMSNITNFLNARVFITSWFEYEEKFGLNKENKKLIKWTKHATIFTIVYVVTVSSCVAFSYICWFDNLESQYWPFTKENETLFYVGMVYYFTSSSLSITLLLSGYVVVFLLMKAIHTELSGLIHKVKFCFREEIDQSKAEAEFDEFLEQLRCLIDVMDKTHDVIKHAVAACYMFVIPAFCCVLYGAISGSMEIGHIVVAVFTMTFSTSMLIAITYGGSWVRDQINLVWSTVCAPRWNQASDSLVLRVSVFASQQNLQSFGISVYGMFVIDWSTFLMIGGTLLTYAVIVVQFQIDKASSNCPKMQSENMTCAT